MNSTSASAAGVGGRPPFTASQWEELERQALIFKYLIAGIPVPPELLIPIRRSYETMAARLYHHPNLGYCSYYGKKLDPEPGRCRRTDGKKWRCSKDAYPDSKYCERHMHRGRNRSRKHVETPQNTLSQSQSSCSTAASLAPSSLGCGSGSGATASVAGGGCGGGSFQSLPLQSIASTHTLASGLSGAAASHLNIDPASYGIIANKDFRYLHGSKTELDERGGGGGGFFCESSGSVRGFGLESSMDNSWRLMPSPVSAFPLSKDRQSSSSLHGSYPQLQPHHGQVTISSPSKHQEEHHQEEEHQQHSFFGSGFGSVESPIRTEQPLRPFFDEWPRTRDLWSDIEDERSNRNSFSTTQLSISIPMSSSDFSATSCRSPNDD